MNPTSPLGQGPPSGALPRPWIILVVDDERDIVNSFQKVLEKFIPGVKVITAISGREGLETLERERIDLIMADFKMPGMDGIEFLVQARHMRPLIPRVMFTAFSNDELARRAMTEALVEAFVSKSVDPAEMVDKVKALLRYEPAPH